MTNSADPDQLASSEANLSGSTLFAKTGQFVFSKRRFKYSNVPDHTIQSNLDSLNTDGSFTMANLNSFLRPYEVLPIAQENKYLGKFSYFIMKLFVVCTH